VNVQLILICLRLILRLQARVSFAQGPQISDPALAEALASVQADFEFRLIEPTAVDGRVMNGEPIPNRPALLLPEPVNQALQVCELRLSRTKWIVSASA
jgi:hypothetical protein